MHPSQFSVTPPHTVLTCLHSASGGSSLLCIFSWFRRAASCSDLVFGVGSISPRCSLFFLLSFTLERSLWIIPPVKSMISFSRKRLIPYYPSVPPLKKKDCLKKS
ncbi:hypothetical protein PMIN04_002154 [Paraphaeosphaeria minitans]